LFLAQEHLSPLEGEDYHSHAIFIYALSVLLHGVVFVWQVVGVLRATESHFATHGSQATVWGAQLSTLLLFWLTASYALDSWQMTLPIPQELHPLARMEREHANRYQLSTDPSSTQLLVVGRIEPGITRQVEKLLAESTAIEQVILESDGGNIYEARGLAKLFQQHRLATHVDTTCASACTSAFIGGAPRSMAADARLGFHQYRVAVDYTIIVTDTASEQQRDQQLFTRAGVSRRFVDHMFSRSADSMWWPSATELQEAGVVDVVAGIR